MRFSPEVVASIVSVAGNWSLGLASSPNPDDNEPPQPSQMSDEMEQHFAWAFDYLIGYVETYADVEY